MAFDYKLIWTALLNNSLALVILVILLTSILNAFIKQRSNDKCLKDFRSFQVTVFMKDGREIEGKLKLFSSGIEIGFPELIYDQDRDYHVQSYIIMNPELEAGLQVIHRYHWNLTSRN